MPQPFLPLQGRLFDAMMFGEDGLALIGGQQAGRFSTSDKPGCKPFPLATQTVLENTPYHFT